MMFLILVEMQDDKAAAEQLRSVMETARRDQRSSDYTSLFEACAYQSHKRGCRKALVQAWRNLLALFNDDRGTAALDYAQVLWNVASTLAEPLEFGPVEVEELGQVLSNGKRFWEGREKIPEEATETRECLLDLIYLVWNSALVCAKQSLLASAAELFELAVDYSALLGVPEEVREIHQMSILQSCICQAEHCLLRFGQEEASEPFQTALLQLQHRTQDCQQAFDPGQYAEHRVPAHVTKSQPLLKLVLCSLHVMQRHDEQVRELVDALELCSTIPSRLFPTIIGVMRACAAKPQLLCHVLDVATQNAVHMLQNQEGAPESSSTAAAPPVVEFILEHAQLISDEGTQLRLFQQAHMLLERYGGLQGLFRQDQLQWLIVKAYNVGVSLLQGAARSVMVSQQLKRSEVWVSLALSFMRASSYGPVYEKLLSNAHQTILQKLANPNPHRS